MALTDDGALFYWVSSDPDLRCHQLYSLCGRNVVNISAGKYWTAAVTSTGDVYMWDGKNGKDKPPVATRLHGTKRATSVSVGETHLLIIGSLYHPAYPSNMVKDPQKMSIIRDELAEIDEDLMFNDMDSENPLPIIQDDASSRNHLNHGVTVISQPPTATLPAVIYSEEEDSECERAHLLRLGVPIETPQLKASSSVLPDGKGNKKAELSRKQRRKNKQIAAQLDIASPLPGAEAEPNPIKGFMNIEISQTSKNKEEHSMSAEIMTSQATKESALCVPKRI
ncbi:hypothetical protein M0R45_000221 [Rubus argutus]|uniref:Uncharacterized protein n=1 Tax=Rubus argutus TaxID=59490 RepID=A0AAW1VQU0_RUBAR